MTENGQHHKTYRLMPYNKKNKAPNGGSDTQHIDGDYAPSSARNLISNINYESYNRMDNINDESSMKMSLDLIFGYMQNGKFNVNTYMSDIRQTPASGDDPTNKYSAFQNIDSLGKKVDQTNYKDYIWTAKPVSSSNEEEAKPTDKNTNHNHKRVSMAKNHSQHNRLPLCFKRHSMTMQPTSTHIIFRRLVYKAKLKI